MTRRTGRVARVKLPIAILLAAAVACFDAARAAPEWMTGVNLSGAEFNATRTCLNTDYTYPTAGEIRFFAAKGFRVFRVPVLSSRLIGVGGRATPDWAALMTLVEVAAASNCAIIIDLHQYGGMPDGLVGRDSAATASFAAFWGDVARRLKDKPNVIFDLMNEPNKQTPTEWRAGVEAGLAAIRQAGARQLVLVSGTAWDGAHSWVSSGNAAAMNELRDPANNFAFELHQYFDKDHSGTHPEVVDNVGARSLSAFTDWARAHKVRGFLGEFGFAGTPDAMKEGNDLLAFVQTNKDVWRGWTAWAAGPWWGSYMFSLEPGKDGTDKPQMTVLERWK